MVRTEFNQATIIVSTWSHAHNKTIIVDSQINIIVWFKRLIASEKNDFPKNPVNMDTSEIRQPDRALINAENHQSK